MVKAANYPESHVNLILTHHEGVRNQGINFTFSQLGGHNSIEAPNATVNPPVTGTVHIYTTMGTLYYIHPDITPKYGELIITDGDMQLQLFETATSTTIVALIINEIEFDRLPPASVIFPRNVMNLS